MALLGAPADEDNMVSMALTWAKIMALLLELLEEATELLELEEEPDFIWAFMLAKTFLPSSTWRTA